MIVCKAVLCLCIDACMYVRCCGNVIPVYICFEIDFCYVEKSIYDCVALFYDQYVGRINFDLFVYILVVNSYSYMYNAM